MSRIQITPKTVAGETASQIDLRIISMPLYPSVDTTTKVFYEYYKSNGLRIEGSGGDGNQSYGSLISNTSRQNLLTALQAAVGTLSSAKLMFFQTGDTNYYIDYTLANNTKSTTVLSGNFFPIDEQNAVITATFSSTSTLPLSQVTKFMVNTDQHYDAAETYAERNQALTRLDNFGAEAVLYQPNAILEGGDKVGAVTLTSATRLTYMQAVSNKMAAAAGSANCAHYKWGWGNHEFDYNSFAEVQSLYAGEQGLANGTLYGYWEDANYRYISLDSNYQPSSQNHLTNQHNGYGYINTDQLTWLTAALASSTKQCIVMVHHPLCELDTEKIFLTKEIYHVQNRVAVRAILEASGKVLFCLHGHCHITAHQVINNIPYLVVADLNTPPATTQHWDTPYTSVSGKWCKIEVDRRLSEIRFYQEVRVSGVVQRIYDLTMPFTPLNPKEFIDATEVYVNDDTMVITKPSSILDGDFRLSPTTIKIQALTDAPNYGRVYADFGSVSSGSFTVSLNARIPTQKTKYFKLMNTNINTPAVYSGFHTNGNFFAYNGATLNNLFTYALNTTYFIEFVVNMTASTYTLKVDGVTIATNYAFNNANATLKQLEVVTETGNLFIDSLIKT